MTELKTDGEEIEKNSVLPNTSEKIAERREVLRKIGVGIEGRIAANELQYLTIDEAREIRQNVLANWEVFASGHTWKEEGKADVTITPEDAMTGTVLNARALLVFAALGEMPLKRAMLGGLSEALLQKGGGVNKKEERELSEGEVIAYARKFIEKSCSAVKFRFGADDGEVQKIILNRLEAITNALYYILATAALEATNSAAFEEVQKDLLLSSNFRLPVLKGIERSRPAEERSSVPGFAQAAPIRHLPPKCIAASMEELGENS